MALSYGGTARVMRSMFPSAGNVENDGLREGGSFLKRNTAIIAYCILTLKMLVLKRNHEYK